VITMDIRRKLQQLEARIGSTFDRKVSQLVQARTREPLEIVHAVVERTAREVQSSGRGRRVFPFTALTLTVAAPSRDERARLEAVFDADPSLRTRIVQRLRADGCAIESLELAVQFVPRPQKNWEQPQYHVEFIRSTEPVQPVAAEPGAQGRIELTVLNGAAQKRTFVLGGPRIDLGRCAEVRDNRHRLVRTNHVAFAEQPGDVNRSVSRRHAHISYDAGAEQFRLHDDGSEHGTGIVREGRTVPVPRGARGVRLFSGDEIVLGEARIRVKFGTDTPQSRQPGI
jgi:pSer/pThr/pTyr-binding forkhead associated (FHA) protein